MFTPDEGANRSLRVAGGEEYIMADFLDSSYELRPGRRKKMGGQIQPVGYPNLTAEQAVDLVYAFLHDEGLHRPEITLPAKDGVIIGKADEVSDKDEKKKKQAIDLVLGEME